MAGCSLALILHCRTRPHRREALVVLQVAGERQASSWARLTRKKRGGGGHSGIEGRAT